MSENTYREAIQKPSDRIILALDNMNWTQAQDALNNTRGSIGLGKANSIAQARGWKHAVDNIGYGGVHTMADAKFHDIPETVRLQVKEVTEARAYFITVHASGKLAMLEAAVVGRQQARDELKESDALMRESVREKLGGILAITVLTSLDTEECLSIYGEEPEKKVIQFAHLAAEAGVDGIVCSGKELRAIRAISALDGLIAVVPGITPVWAKKAGDQKRVVTPKEALQEGADFVVVGRAITQPPEGISSQEAAQRVAQELEEAA
jgi:orotidine-5'-phosphate decarboxylase